ncbi:hypothetical protein GN244_ATG20037 [Phytophthora infestans]|uniref:Beta-adaptin appendage C-terminal subdomain domain-containing protein n=1 Tax=Phytophthora infestans TaxID=4787 RepID=A0A833STP9_PHYIN|nr:hypothetical protein GN244_ATG20037 [Phytophthora infestans]KAF4137254.1 hypothetical protein GN958_ATG13517 [Phytophthora infestans]KAI9998646.1 hypothetical protein PInf_003228 [Phytophthora infestans]
MQQSAEDAAAELQRRNMPSSTTIFQFRRQSEDRGVVSKSSGRSSSSTPRNVIVPDLTDIGEAALPTAPPEENIPVSGPAKKYLQTGNSRAPPVEPKHKVSTRVMAPGSLRGKVHFYCGDGKAAVGAVRSARRALGHLSLQQGIAFLMLLAGMLSESGTPAPRYNVPIAIALILLPAAEDDGLQREHHRMYITGLALATALDFVWLMRPQEGAFNGYFVESTKSFTDVGIAFCSLAKISLIFCNYLELVDTEPFLDEDSEEARKAPAILPPSFRLWDKLKFFFPRRTLPKRAQLSLEVLHRVLVLAWIHLICGILLLGLGLIGTVWYSGRTQFRVHPVGIPLYIMLLLKSATTLLTYLTVSHRINYDACLELYGLRSRDSNTRVRQVDGVQIRLPQEPVLAYNRAWLHRVQRAKAVDGIAGGYLLLVFYAALRSGQVVGGRGVPAMLACIALVQLVLDVWTPLLILVAGRCGSALYTLHHQGIPGTDPLFPPQLRWDDSDEDDSDDSDSSDDDSESDSDSNGDHSFHSSSSSGDADRAPAERRERRLRHRQRRLEDLRASPREPQLPIVDADAVAGNQTARSARDIATARDIVDSANSSGTGVWVRHWHEASKRAYLVHSITNEAVWEAPKQSTTPPMSARLPASTRESVRLDSARLTPDSARFTPAAFDNHWKDLADGGGFNCRVSRIPEMAILGRHLHEHEFIVVSDGLGVSQQRTVLFYAEDFEDDEDSDLMFMGEFVFDSLSLKLRARFRCSEPEQIVQFVKRLQLKEIVGAYAPCD